jgi:Flp pilus assembly protein TadD
MEKSAADLYKDGMSAFARQDFAAAVTVFHRAIEMEPAFADVHQAMAHCHEKLGDLDAALSCAQRAVEHAADDALAHTSLSMLYQRKGMIDEAETEKALALKLQRSG